MSLGMSGGAVDGLPTRLPCIFEMHCGLILAGSSSLGFASSICGASQILLERVESLNLASQGRKHALLLQKLLFEGLTSPHQDFLGLDFDACHKNLRHTAASFLI